MLEKQNIIIEGFAGKPIAADIHFNPNATANPLIIYAHGFNGFKDWANFDLIANQFVQAGFTFVKFNFSHNGTSPNFPEDFVDLESYASNNYTIQLFELGKVIDLFSDNEQSQKYLIDAGKIYLLGHSLGGGLVLLKSAEDERIKKVVTWSAISECKTPWGNWNEMKIDNWRKTGVSYTVNSRTLQEMPLNFQLYEDYENNIERLNIENAIKKLDIPILICHGTIDGSVTIEKARQLKVWQPSATLFEVESDHVFGRKHPWLSKDLPEPMQIILNKTIEFF